MLGRPRPFGRRTERCLQALRDLAVKERRDRLKLLVRYGGKVRPFLLAGLLRLLDAKERVLWTVYDEYVVEVKEPFDNNKELELIELICQRPSWCHRCPIAVDPKRTPHYTK